MSALFILWLAVAMLSFGLAIRTEQAAGGLVLTAVAAALWPIWAVLVLAGMVFDLLVFLYQVFRRPH